MAVMVILFSFLCAGEATAHKVGRIWAKCLLGASNIKVSLKGFSNINLEKALLNKLKLLTFKVILYEIRVKK